MARDTEQRVKKKEKTLLTPPLRRTEQTETLVTPQRVLDHHKISLGELIGCWVHCLPGLLSSVPNSFHYF